MTLAKRCKDLLDATARLGVADREHDTATALATRADNLRSLIESLQPILSARRVMVGAGIAEGDEPTSLSYFASSLQELQRAHEQDPFKPELVVLKPLEQAASQIVKQLEDSLSRAWSMYFEKESPTVSEAVLNALSCVSKLRPNVEKIRNLRVVARTLSATLPQTAGTLAMVKKNFSDTAEAIKSLETNDISPEVTAFLQAMGSGGAAIDLLTPKVIVWLKSNKLEESFRIVAHDR